MHICAIYLEGTPDALIFAPNNNNNDTDNTDHTARRRGDSADDQPALRDHTAGDGTTAPADGTADEPTANG